GDDVVAAPAATSKKRIRAEGGGRKSFIEKNPGVIIALESLLDGNTVGNPENPLKWTVKSTRTLSNALKEKGFEVSNTTVGKILTEMGYSLQQNRKYTENGKPDPDRNDQFENINSKVTEFMNRGLPVISVDAKKKENIGNFKNQGAEYRPKGEPRLVNDHDFCSKHAVPYGVFDIASEEGFVNVGIAADTAEFAVESISVWWHLMGSKRYPGAKEVLITCDSGGSNGYRVRLWKLKLQELADFTGLTFHVSHFPAGTSKWNKIEHRMFSFISRNWKGQPLEDYETVVNLIGSTTNSKGLKIKCLLDKWDYERGIVVTDEEFEKINLVPDEWRGDWNYTIGPKRKL
ncbi:MAG: ISAzo13 family transposase, partial [archaeon]|nr:ISAzo13 family transposase [archaeon]